MEQNEHCEICGERLTDNTNGPAVCPNWISHVEENRAEKARAESE